MTERRGARRPISRRLMVALFALMLAPMSGWYFLCAFEPLDQSAASDQRAALERARLRVRQRLTLTLGVSILVLGGVVFYVKRTMIEPLAELAAQARQAQTDAWEPPRSLERPDELGDLARALHGSITALEARAAQATRFAASLSHELRTPLAAIRGAAQILEDPSLERASQERFVRNIITESQRLERLVAGLLDMERAEQGNLAKETGSCALDALLPQLLQQSAPLMMRKSLRCHSTVQASMAPVAAGEDRARRIVMGLLENAIKFSPKAGTIEVRAALSEGEARVEIEDEGPGVPSALREKIFARAYSAPGSAEGRRGTGLGLAIVRSLVTASGGRVWVESAEGPGARFVLTLPLAPEQKPAGEESPQPRS